MKMDKNLNYNDITVVMDSKTLNTLKESFDRDYEKQKNIIEAVEYADSMKDKSFGFIKEAIEGMSGELFRTKEGRSLLNRYISCIKENSELKKMHLLRECIRKASKDDDIDRYIGEATSMIGRVCSVTAPSQVRLASNILSEACKLLGKEKSSEIISSMNWNEGLNEAIEYIETHAKKPSNLANFYDCTRTIKESVAINEAIRVVATTPAMTDEKVETAINEFNKKFSDVLGEPNKQLVKELAETNDKKLVFEKYKNSCIEKLNEKKTLFENNGDRMTAERIGIVLEKVNSKSYDPKDVNDDLVNFIEMINSL